MKLPYFSEIREIVLDVLFPPLCLACRRALVPDEKPAALCGGCLSSIFFYNAFSCGTCGNRLPQGKKTCHKEMPYLLAAATRYSDAVPQTLIRRLKYERLRAAASPLAAILAAYLKRLGADFSSYTIMPIPLHPTRLKDRGFNQAELLAERVADSLRIPLAANALMRVKNNKPQAELADRGLRRENMKSCFAVPDLAAVKGKHILLLDDVHTSGATITEAALVLRAAGAKKIIALVVARA